MSIRLFIQAFVLSIFAGICSAGEIENRVLLSQEEIARWQHNADSWITHEVAMLNEEQLELLANMLYCSHQFNQIDVETKSLTRMLLNMVWYMNHQIQHYEDNAELLDQCATLSHIVKELNKRRMNAFIVWQQCSQIIDVNADEQLHKALNVFKDHMQHYLTTFVELNDKQTDKDLAAMELTLKEESAAFKELAGLYKALYNNEVITETPTHQKLVKVDNAFKLVDAIENHSWKVLQTSLSIAEKPLLLQGISGQAFVVYYNKLSQFIQSKNTIVHLAFGPSGFLNKEQRTEQLPIEIAHQ